MKILIVEDRFEDRRLLRYTVGRHGHTVIEAADGREGLEMAVRDNPDLIISDALMPRMDGFQFLRQVKQDKNLRSIPFIFYAVPSEILSKPTQLSDLEFALIKVHPQASYDILKDIDFPWPLAKIVLQHHERMNGSGYPLGLKGNDILLEARILTVADVVEAMSSHRPYRPSKGIDSALEEISNNKDTLYDRLVVNACLKLFREKQFRFD